MALNRRKRRTCLAVLATLGCASGGAPPAPAGGPDAVIVFIADGAGVEHWTLARFASDNLAVDGMPVGGLVHTAGADHEVTGSAPGATALASGVRTSMGAVGVDARGDPVETVLERAHAQGWATGLVTTTFLPDATPAAFASHVESRAQLVAIFQAMTRLPVNVLLGGGRRLIDAARERSQVDLLGPLEGRYTYVRTADELDGAVASRASYVLGLFAEGDMPRAPDREPSLPDMTRAALEVLARNPAGFFLMIENEGSDTEAHGNAERRVIVDEMLDFDAAVRVGLAYRREHPGTLVVVTGDHETGGISLTPDSLRNVTVHYATGGHTAAMVPLFAEGPGSERLGGLLDNDEVGRILKELVAR